MQRWLNGMSRHRCRKLVAELRPCAGCARFVLPEVLRRTKEAANPVQVVLSVQGAVDQRDQFRDIKRFEEIAGGAMPDGLLRRFERPVAGDDDDFNSAAGAFDGMEQIESVPVRKLEVQRDKVNRLRQKRLQGF